MGPIALQVKSPDRVGLTHQGFAPARSFCDPPAAAMHPPGEVRSVRATVWACQIVRTIVSCARAKFGCRPSPLQRDERTARCMWAIGCERIDHFRHDIIFLEISSR